MSAVLFGAAKLILERIPPVTLAGLLYLGAAAVAGPSVAVQPLKHTSTYSHLRIQ